MGKFFNSRIRDLPSSEVRKLKRSVVVKENPIYGQTKGYLETLRKEFNDLPEEDIQSPSTPTTEPENTPERQKILDRMANTRAARKNG